MSRYDHFPEQPDFSDAASTQGQPQTSAERAQIEREDTERSLQRSRHRIEMRDMNDPAANEVEMSVARAFVLREQSPEDPDLAEPPLISTRALREHGTANPDGTRKAMDSMEAISTVGVLNGRGYIEQNSEGSDDRWRMSPKWLAERYPTLRQRIMQEVPDPNNPVWGVTKAEPYRDQGERSHRKVYAPLKPYVREEYQASLEGRQTKPEELLADYVHDKPAAAHHEKQKPPRRALGMRRLLSRGEST